MQEELRSSLLANSAKHSSLYIAVVAQGTTQGQSHSALNGYSKSVICIRVLCALMEQIIDISKIIDRSDQAILADIHDLLHKRE